jgi:hypothetical protein
MFVRLLIVALPAFAPQGQAPLFTDSERQAVVAYWSEPGRYTVGPPLGTQQTGRYVVRLTPEGSSWLWKYNRARGIGKTAPSRNPGPQNDAQKAWESWIDAKVARDRWEAGRKAEQMNKEADGSTPILADTIEPADPGPMPEGLKALAGDAPAFAACVEPKQHTISFDASLTLTYQDYVPMRARYAYFRFPQGVMSSGDSVKRMDPEAIDAIFRDAGVSPFEQKVMKAVSTLEGGFDSINTYDTGFVSVGLIQFACLQAGAGSLGRLLQRYKEAEPEAFQADFRAFGIDVNSGGVLEVVDPVSGDELSGHDAAMKIVGEPRLAAVFQRAGKLSRKFRIAQIQAAKSMFYPGSDSVTFTLAGKTVTAKVGDIIKTEAGMATLMDRKVNTGKLDPLPAVLTRIAQEMGATEVADLSDCEYEITAAMRYRSDFLSNRILAQPDRHGSHGSGRGSGQADP